MTSLIIIGASIAGWTAAREAYLCITGVSQGIHRILEGKKVGVSVDELREILNEETRKVKTETGSSKKNVKDAVHDWLLWPLVLPKRAKELDDKINNEMMIRAIRKRVLNKWKNIPIYDIENDKIERNEG